MTQPLEAQPTPPPQRLYSWAPALALVLITALLQSTDTASLLQYQRQAIASGEIWRLLSGHLLHLSWPHWLLNCAALVLIWELFFTQWPVKRSVSLLLVLALGVSAGLWWLSPTVDWYVGLSGLLHGLLVTGVITATQYPWYVRGLIVVGIVIKLVAEQLHGPTTSLLLEAAPVIVAAHSYGAISGGIWAIVQGAYHFQRR